MKRNGLVAATVYYVVGNGVFAALPLLLLPVLTQRLGPAGYGHWVAFTVIAAVLVSLGGLGAHGFLVVEWPKAAATAQRAGLLVGSLLVGTGGIAVAALLLGGYLWLMPMSLALEARWLPMAGLLAAATMVVLVYSAIWQSRAQAAQYMVFRIAHAVALAIAALLTLLVWRGVWDALALAYVTVAIAAAASCMVLHRGITAEGIADAPRHTWAAARFGLTLLPHSIGGVAMSAMDKLLIGALLSAADLGAYGVAWQLCLVLSLLTDSANRSYAPWLYAFLAAGKHRQTQPAIELVKASYLAMAGLLALATAFGLALQWLMAEFIGAEFASAVDCALPISLGHGFTGAYYLVVNYVMFRQRFLPLAVVSIGAGTSNVLLAVLLIKGSGIEGAAWAFAASQALLFLGTWWLAARQVPMPWRLQPGGMR